MGFLWTRDTSIHSCSMEHSYRFSYLQWRGGTLYQHKGVCVWMYVNVCVYVSVCISTYICWINTYTHNNINTQLYIDTAKHYFTNSLFHVDWDKFTHDTIFVSQISICNESIIWLNKNSEILKRMPAQKTLVIKKSEYSTVNYILLEIAFNESVVLSNKNGKTCCNN